MNRGKLCATVSFWHDFNRICDAADHSWAVIQYYIHANLCDHHQRRTDFLSSELAPDCVESPGNSGAREATTPHGGGPAEQTWKTNVCGTDFPLLAVPVPSNSLPFLSISVSRLFPAEMVICLKRFSDFQGCSVCYLLWEWKLALSVALPGKMDMLP